MAKKPRPPSTYELLGQRIQRVTNSPRAQSDRCAESSRQPDKSPDDWQRLVFPGQGPKNPVLSEATINKAIALVGYKGKLTGHGPRHTASTLLREHGWPKDHVEAQLAHIEAGVAGVYNQSAYLEHRRRMMQWYSDYLDALALGITDKEKSRFKTRVE